MELRTKRFPINVESLIVAIVKLFRALIQQRAKTGQICARIVMEGSSNLDEPVQGKLQFAALREPLLFPCLVSFKEPLPVEKVGAARNSGTHTGIIVA